MACHGGEIPFVARHENGALPICMLVRDSWLVGARCMAHATCCVTQVVARHRMWQVVVVEEDVAEHAVVEQLPCQLDITVGEQMWLSYSGLGKMWWAYMPATIHISIGFICCVHWMTFVGAPAVVAFWEEGYRVGDRHHGDCGGRRLLLQFTVGWRDGSHWPLDLARQEPSGATSADSVRPSVGVGACKRSHS